MRSSPTAIFSLHFLQAERPLLACSIEYGILGWGAVGTRERRRRRRRGQSQTEQGCRDVTSVVCSLYYSMYEEGRARRTSLGSIKQSIHSVPVVPGMYSSVLYSCLVNLVEFGAKSNRLIELVDLMTHSNQCFCRLPNIIDHTYRQK